jgi:hypothetical protein
LRRPRPETIAQLEAEIADCDEARRVELMAELDALKAKFRRIPHNGRNAIYRRERRPFRRDSEKRATVCGFSRTGGIARSKSRTNAQGKTVERYKH